MKTFDLAAAVTAAFLSTPAEAAPILHANAAGPILMDGNCDDAAWQRAGVQDIGAGARLRVTASDDFVYICIEGPPESFTNVDLYILNGTSVYNLHASAALGERIRSDDGWPAYQWWNHHGWTANWLPYLGRRVENGREVARFAFAAGREFQIARSKFPSSEWRVMVDVHELATDTGMDGEARYPALAREDDPNSWARLVISGAPRNAGVWEPPRGG